ncbi:hypothetical protein [Flavobacterium piscis]|uniref:Uncharacterized protein n=1 Tax=Flavobacterium piscis TaxID=1114874 RepID=A0ABX2XPR9_9FLAO|nr:hypothetical protein [Flavobacterium piscis]OCB78267.1 hypothetical protein FLP_00760 [Flavobacterium piscis]
MVAQAVWKGYLFCHKKLRRFAYACKLSFQRGNDGNVSFLSKSQLVDRFEKILGAFHFGGRIMIIETKSALKLINKYFQNK